MTMITPSYLGETIEYSSLHACRSTLEDPTPNHFSAPSVVSVAAVRNITPARLVDVRGGHRAVLRPSSRGANLARTIYAIG